MVNLLHLVRVNHGQVRQKDVGNNEQWWGEEGGGGGGGGGGGRKAKMDVERKVESRVKLLGVQGMRRTDFSWPGSTMDILPCRATASLTTL